MASATNVKCEGCKGYKGGEYFWTILGWLCEACHRGFLLQGVIRK